MIICRLFFEVNNSRDMSGIVMDALGCYKSAVDNRHYPIECIYSDLQESGIGCVSGLFDVSVGLGEYGSKIFANNISGSKQHWNFNVSPSSINLLIKYVS